MTFFFPFSLRPATASTCASCKSTTTTTDHTLSRRASFSPSKLTAAICISLSCVIALVAVSLHQLSAGRYLPLRRLSPRPPSFLTFAPRTSAAFKPRQLLRETTAQSQPRIRIWTAPRGCRGNFNTGSRKAAFPYVALREAVVDRRPKSVNILGKNDVPRGGTSRIVLYFSVDRYTNMTLDASTVQLGSDVAAADFEWITEVFPTRQEFAAKNVLKEWQIGLRIRPREGVWDAQNAVKRALSNNAAMNLKISVLKPDGNVMAWKFSLALRCVMGWTTPGVEHLENRCEKGGDGANGAILFSGSALHGHKKKQKRYVGEVAGFVARGLMGPMKYDSVAVTVVTDYSASDLQRACALHDEKCRAKLEDQNDQLMKTVATNIEEDLIALGLPRRMLSKVMVIPFCRLGTDANGTEKNNPCKRSLWNGQIHSLFSTYSMISPYFKWAVSHDIDEFLAPVPPVSKSRMHWKQISAEETLDRVNRKNGSRGQLIFQWLIFRVQSLNDVRPLTKEIINGVVPKIINKTTGSIDECYGRMKWWTGKAAVRCDVGLGFTVHHPVVTFQGTMQHAKGFTSARDLRAWHGRLKHALGSCKYSPSQN